MDSKERASGQGIKRQNRGKEPSFIFSDHSRSSSSKASLSLSLSLSLSATRTSTHTHTLLFLSFSLFRWLLIRSTWLVGVTPCNEICIPDPRFAFQFHETSPPLSPPLYTGCGPPLVLFSIALALSLSISLPLSLSLIPGLPR